MVKLTPQERTLIVSLYRSLKSNPKEFQMSDDDKLTLVKILDLDAFDINLNSETITYYVYDVGVPLLVSSLDKEATHGEDSRVLYEALRRELYQRCIKMLVEIRKGNMPDAIIVNAAYLHIGISSGIIPTYYDVYPKNNLDSDIYSAAKLIEEEEKRVKDGNANS